MQQLNESEIKKELEIDANALGIPLGSAEVFINRAYASASKRLSKRSIVTELDIRNAIFQELSKYHKDFAYVYKNRGKII